MHEVEEEEGEEKESWCCYTSLPLIRISLVETRTLVSLYHQLFLQLLLVFPAAPSWFLARESFEQCRYTYSFQNGRCWCCSHRCRMHAELIVGASSIQSGLQRIAWRLMDVFCRKDSEWSVWFRFVVKSYSSDHFSNQRMWKSSLPTLCSTFSCEIPFSCKPTRLF